MIPIFAVEELIEHARREPRQQFVRRLGELVLVGPPELPTTDTGAWSFATQPGISSVVTDVMALLRGSMAFGLRKQGRSGPFPNVILIGRAKSNDLCIDHVSVSKLHARVHREGSSHTLIDAGSTNGTLFNGRALRPGESRELATGATLKFGDYPFRVYSSSTLHTMLKAFNGP